MVVTRVLFVGKRARGQLTLSYLHQREIVYVVAINHSIASSHRLEHLE